jgi:transcriptional regulator with XRE-family HTH domain
MTKKIKRLMKQNNETLTQIARDLGVTRTWVSLVVNRRGKSARVWKEIARRVKRPVGEIDPSYAQRASEGKPIEKQRKAA